MAEACPLLESEEGEGLLWGGGGSRAEEYTQRVEPRRQAAQA